MNSPKVRAPDLPHLLSFHRHQLLFLARSEPPTHAHRGGGGSEPARARAADGDAGGGGFEIRTPIRTSVRSRSPFLLPREPAEASPRSPIRWQCSPPTPPHQRRSLPGISFSHPFPWSPPPSPRPPESPSQSVDFAVKRSGSRPRHLRSKRGRGRPPRSVVCRLLEWFTHGQRVRKSGVDERILGMETFPYRRRLHDGALTSDHGKGNRPIDDRAASSLRTKRACALRSPGIDCPCITC